MALGKPGYGASASDQPQNAFESILEWMKGNRKIVYIVLGVLVFFIFLNPITFVKVGHKGVVLKFGAVSGRILSEGINVRVPFMEDIVQVSVQVRKTEEESHSASKDLQSVTTQLALNYHISPEGVNDLFRTVGTTYEDKIIEPAVLEVMKATTAKYTASELITKRELVSQNIKEGLKERLRPYWIIIDEISMKDFKFAESFNQAIEAKQKSEQDALKAKNDLDKIKVEAEQQIATARAEAESLRMKSQQLTPLMVKLEQIKAWKEGGSKVPTYMGCGKESIFMNMPTEKE